MASLCFFESDEAGGRPGVLAKWLLFVPKFGGGSGMSGGCGISGIFCDGCCQ